MLVQESVFNATEGYFQGEGEPVEAFTDDVGELFRFCQKEYGRCVSSVYIDGPSGEKVRRVGWVFHKRARYEDTGDPFIQETWITLHDAEPERTIHHHYHELA